MPKPTTPSQPESFKQRAERLLGINAPTGPMPPVKKKRVSRHEQEVKRDRLIKTGIAIAGALVLENYPLGPLAGTAFNLTLLSYNGSMDMGLNMDAAAVAEPALLRDELVKAFTQIVKLDPTPPEVATTLAAPTVPTEPTKKRWWQRSR